VVAPLTQPGPRPAEIRLLPQEREGECRFEGQFVTTSHAMERFGQAIILAALLVLRMRLQDGASLDYLQVFEIDGARLWIIDDGAVTTALLPSDY